MGMGMGTGQGQAPTQALVVAPVELVELGLGRAIDQPPVRSP